MQFLLLIFVNTLNAMVISCCFQVPCESCQVLLQTLKPTGDIYALISNLDNGGLKYPSAEMVGLCKLTCIFVERVMKSPEVRRCGNICRLLQTALLPHLTQCPALICEKGDPSHTEDMCRVILQKLLRVLLGNWAGNINLTVERLAKLVHKPLSRKVLRM